MKRTLILMAAIAVAALSCKKTEDPSITLERELIEVSDAGGVETVRVACDLPTKTTVEYVDGQDWIFLLPTYLKAGGGVLEFRISRYTGTQAPRTAKAVVACGDVTKTIEIRQAAKVITDLELSSTSIGADVEGGKYEISVYCGFPWTATCSDPWFVIENGSGDGPGNFSVTIPRSTDYKYRSATVTVKTDKLSRELLVQSVGTRIGDKVWANSNVNEPDTFGENCEVRGLLYQYNCKVGYPSYSANDHGDTETVVPNFPTGPYDTMSEVWAEENDPCPDGWRVPTVDELKSLIGADESGARMWFDYDMVNGMSVAGAYVGLDKEIMKEDCGKGHLNGAIFIPQAGRVNRDTGIQDDWWDACLWSCTNVGQTWDMFGLWMNGNQDFGIEWYGSRTGCSVRCILK